MLLGEVSEAIEKLTDVLIVQFRESNVLEHQRNVILASINLTLTKIELILKPKPVKLLIKFDNQEPGMPIQLTDAGAGSSTIATPSELDPAGNPVTIDPTQINYTVSDPTAFTLTPNNTTTAIQATDGAGNAVSIPPGGCQFKAIGTAGHLGDFQATCTDTANGLNSQDVITVVAGKATTLQMNFAPAS